MPPVLCTACFTGSKMSCVHVGRRYLSSQDLRFYAILKKGPFVSTPESAFVRVDDVLGTHYFAMPVLLATSLATDYQDFEIAGLFGIWTLKENLLAFECPATDFSLLLADDNPFATAYRTVESHLQSFR